MAQVIKLSDRQMVARVKRGACLLDKHRPGWEREIDLKRLGLLENDILSQLCGDPMSALQNLGFGSVRDHLEQLYTEIPATTSRCGSLADYGFAAFREEGGGEWRQAYHELRRLWRSEVRTRLSPSIRRVVDSATESPQVSHGPL